MAQFVIVEPSLHARTVVYNLFESAFGGFAMNLKWLTILSDGLLLLGLICLGSGWQGSATMTGAFPFHSSAVQLTGGATGTRVLLGLPSLLAGLVLMIVSLVWTIFEALQKVPRS